MKTESEKLVFVADLGGTHLRAAVIDERGKIRYQLKRSTPRAEKPNEIVQALITAAHECQNAIAQTGSISAVSVAVPGTVDVGTGRIIKAPNLPCLDGFRLVGALESELTWPATLENDANAAAIGEMWKGAAEHFKTVICVTLGTGVGGGIILDGKLWRGANGSAAEIGHMSLEPFAGVPCACGNRGCLEVYASGTAIVRMTREALPRYPNSVLHKCESLSSEAVYKAGVDGDELALEVFRRMGAYLGVGIANLINLLNPEIIVVAGGVANGWSLFEEHMRQQVVERAFPLPASSVKIVRGSCGDDAGLLGAARLAFERRKNAGQDSQDPQD
jgi:glucokinase